MIRLISHLIIALSVSVAIAGAADIEGGDGPILRTFVLHIGSTASDVAGGPIGADLAIKPHINAVGEYMGHSVLYSGKIGGVKDVVIQEWELSPKDTADIVRQLDIRGMRSLNDTPPLLIGTVNGGLRSIITWEINGKEGKFISMERFQVEGIYKAYAFWIRAHTLIPNIMIKLKAGLLTNISYASFEDELEGIQRKELQNRGWQLRRVGDNGQTPIEPPPSNPSP